LLASATLLLALLLLDATAAPPVITRIERWNTNQVLLHFDTEAGRTYHLEYTTNLPVHGLSSATWSNLFTGPNYPFPNHYIIPDTGTNRQRFYRLRVTTP